MPSSPSKLRKNPRGSTNFSFPMLPPPPVSIYKAKVSVKLDEEKDNFLIWRQLVEPVIKSHRLHMFLTRSAIRRNAGASNNDFDEKDQILFSWILSTLSESMLARVIGCANSKQLWEKLHNFFKNRARAKVTRYQSELKNIKKKDTESILEYLLRIKILIDYLDFAERPVNLQEHIDAILEGLPETEEYEPFVTLINDRSQSVPCTVQQIEFMLLLHEIRIEVKKVQINNESDEYARQSQLTFNRDIVSGPQPINPSSAAAAASNIQYSPPVWTSPHTHSSFHVPMNMRPPMTMSHEPQNYRPIAAMALNYASAMANITNQTTDLSLYAPPN
jgi:histone deacetylase 1/2